MCQLFGDSRAKLAVSDTRVKQQEIQSLQKAADNRKSRSKKIINLKIINAEIYATYYEQVKNKRANTQRKKTFNKQSRKPKRKINNRRRKKALSPLISNNEDDGLEEGIKLPIKKENEAVDNTVDDDNGVGV